MDRLLRRRGAHDRYTASRTPLFSASIAVAIAAGASGCGVRADDEASTRTATVAEAFTPGAPPSPLAVVEGLATSTGCLIQSDLGRFEVVVLQGKNLVHYWHDNASPNYTWHRGEVISTQGAAIAPGCLIQSDFQSGGHGTFEVVVQEGTNLVHYRHDNSTLALPWQRAQTIATGVSGPGAIIQSDFKSGGHGNFEVVVPVGSNLVHFFHDDPNLSLPWQQAQTIATGVSGPGAIIQSDFKSGSHGNFEVAVPVGASLVHYFHDNSNVSLPWQRLDTIATGIRGPGSLIQSDFKSGGHGNFEVVVPIGSSLVHYFHDNSNASLPWQQAQTVATGVTGPGSIIQSSFKSGSHGNFEVAVEAERATLQPNAVIGGGGGFDQNLMHYWHDNSDVTLPWGRVQPITYRGRSEKVCQLSGSYDQEVEQPTTSNTYQFGLTAVDLGYPVDNGRQLSFLFGDARVNGSVSLAPYPESGANDAFGWTTDTAAPTPDDCVHLTVASRAITSSWTLPTPPIVSPPIDQGWFNVPASGFVTNEGLYGLFWTDHCAYPDPLFTTCDTGHPKDPAANLIGRNVLARSTDNGASFQHVADLPRPFVYTASVDTDRMAGLPAGQNVGVLVYGVPCYRESTPYLASVPSSQVDDISQWQYFEGLSGATPTWSADPTASKTVFQPSTDQLLGDARCSWRDAPLPADAGCIGEFSVDWDPGLHKWVMLYGCADPSEKGSTLEEGIRIRLADAPWGPWSDPTTIFTPDNDSGDHGYCHFMHADVSPACDDVGGGNGGDWGGAYAPYLLTRYSEVGYTGPEGFGARLYYAMSTWNPYQVVVMKTDILVPCSNVCGSACCASGETCNDGQCGYGQACGNDFCGFGATCCGGSCCNGTCMNGDACCSTAQTCGDQCCGAGQFCSNGACVTGCPDGTDISTSPTGTELCCPLYQCHNPTNDDVCVAASCNESCCAPGQVCCNSAASPGGLACNDPGQCEIAQ